MSGLSKTGTVLVAVFVFCLSVFAAQLVYVWWWSRRFRQRSAAASELDVISSRGGDAMGIPLSPPTKELLYFFFICPENNQFRIEPATAPPLPPPPETALAVAIMPPINDVAPKRPPPSTGLFTLAKEREGSGADGITDGFDPTAEMEQSVIVALDDEFYESDQNNVVESCGESDHYDEEATPFSTPCASPPYYTPSPSPDRDDVTVTSV